MPDPAATSDPTAEARPAPRPDEAEVDACLRVLARLRHADPADPAWEDIRDAVAHAHRVVKKIRGEHRRKTRRAQDRAVLAQAARFREQNPPAGPSAESAPGGGGELHRARRCYVCKDQYREVGGVYHQLCPDCAQANADRRLARCDLRGRTAVVTGGRIKIGFHTALRLLRDGARVLVTTRFPRDAARRFAAQPDAADWLDRLHVHGVDLLDLPAVAALPGVVHERFAHLDILVNNAAQTIRRPPAYHREVRAREAAPLTGAAARIDVAAGTAAVPALPDGTAMAVGTALPVSTAPADADAAFPAGKVDETGEPLDLRDHNSWTLRLHEIDPAEWLETQLVNAFAPFLLTSRLRGLLCASPFPDRYIVQVSAMEGSFSRRGKRSRHAHTNMAKASLNMMTRTAAADYAADGVHMTSVDTGWITDERPHPARVRLRAEGFRPPLDVVDGAARVYDPIVRGVRDGEYLSGVFLKDYRATDW